MAIASDRDFHQSGDRLWFQGLGRLELNIFEKSEIFVINNYPTRFFA
jgi:hypothetical protein